MVVRPSQLPRISVVVPSYNQGHFLPEALDSIFRQEYPDLEVVVMDGGSTDESVSIIQSWSHRLKYWQSQKDGGQSAAINAGVRHCSGKLVAWLNSDDFYCRDALWSAGQAYAAFPDHGLYVGNGLRFEQNTGAYTPFCSRHVAFNRAALLEGTDYILQPSTFFLREAWEKVGGLDLTLSFCMDWDIFIRIGELYPAVTIQEFLGVSREYEETKTRSGKMKRAAEIVRMVQAHTRTEVTPGSLLFLLETLVEITRESGAEEINHHFRAAQQAVARQICMKFGGGHGFPERSDPQDHVYLPFAKAESVILPRAPRSTALPTISIITPSLNQGDYLQQTLDSIRNQKYEHLENVVIDADGNDAAAINKGLARAKGEILAWVNPGDLLAEGALQEVALAFAADPDLDFVFGNAVTIDAAGQFLLADHGPYRSGLWIGAFNKPESWPAYGSDVHGVPQPTVFFRWRLLQQFGPVDESFRLLFDYELFARYAKHAKVKKIERIQAFCRVRTGNRERWSEILFELYRLGRLQEPALDAKTYPAILRKFVTGYMRRKFGGRPQLRSATAAVLAALTVVTRVANPKRWWKNRLPIANQQVPVVAQPAPTASPPAPIAAPPAPITEQHVPPACVRILRPFIAPKREKGTYHSLFCAPRFNVRELQILSFLHEISTIGCFSQSPDLPADLSAARVDALHTSATIAAMWPDLIGRETLWGKLRNRLAVMLRRTRLPISRSRNPLFVTEQLPSIYTHCQPAIQEALVSNAPDFLFVSPQTNPLALTLKANDTDTRFILIVNQVEAAQIQLLADSSSAITRLTHQWEAQRARRFEQENLALYDGVIAASERDRQCLADDYDYPVERIRVVGKGADPGFGAWLAELKTLPRYSGTEVVLPFDAESRRREEIPLAKGA